jgi:hypothetical protein
MPELQRQEAHTLHHGNNTKVSPTYANISSEQPTHTISDTISTFLTEIKILLNPLLFLLTVLINKQQNPHKLSQPITNNCIQPIYVIYTP